MIDRDEAEQLLEAEGHLFLGAEPDVGRDAGPVLRVYLDEYSGWPSFATVAGAKAGRESLVALHQAHLRHQGDGVQVPYGEDTLNQAPTVGADQDPSISEEDALFDYYGVPVDGVVPVVGHLGSVLVPHPPARGRRGRGRARRRPPHPLSRHQRPLVLSQLPSSHRVLVVRSPRSGTGRPRTTAEPARQIRPLVRPDRTSRTTTDERKD